MILKLTNNVKTYSFEVEDMNNGEKLYYHFQIPTADMENGKYNMVLLDGDEIVAEEQVCIGDFNPQTIQYSRGENVYINAPLVTDVNIENNKQVEISTINTTILPSAGFDVMGMVEVNAQSVYDNGYNEGETDQKAKLTGITITENGTYSREDGYNEITVDVPDLNGDYNEGYEAGKVDGYEQGNITGYENGFVEGNATGYANGVNDGKAEQKALLEPITITENGVYSTEDGYSEVTVNIEDTTGSYDVGYSDGYEAGIEEGTANAGEIIAETARVLNITENGHYLSKYSEPIIINAPTPTGKFANGDNFYNYAKLDGVVFDTGIVGEPNIKYELWWKPDGHFTDYYTVLGYQNFPYQDFKLCEKGNLRLGIEYGRQWNLNDISFAINNDWNHFLLSKNDGVIVNGNLVAEITQTMSDEVESPTVWINAAKSDELNYNANGYFGMIKITANGVENVIIPTAEGFLNTTTNELLTTLQNGDYTFIEPEFEYAEPTGNLIKTVNVNVIPKINVVESGIKLKGSTFTEIPKWVDFEGVTDLGGMFSDCTNLTELPILNVPYCMNFEGMFSGIRFTDLTNIQYWVYPKNAKWSLTFEQNTQVEKCSAIYMEGISNYYQGSPFWAYSDMNNFTDFGGFIGLKYSITQDYIFPKMPNLSYESCINVLNGLYDFTGNGETPNSYQGQLKVHQNFLDAVGDEISIGVAKGWIISA